MQKYKYFVGETWERYGEAAWMGEWRQVYARPVGAKPNILAELKSIKDISTSQSVPMILDVVQDAQSGKQALVSAYDDPSVVNLEVYNLGDGGAMSGVLVAGRRSNGETTFLVFLLD